jgi:hypothetical protein
MTSYYDDNFGQYNDGDSAEEVRDFYFSNQRRSVTKACRICGRTVKLLPQYDKCNSCCEMIESGMDVGA